MSLLPGVKRSSTSNAFYYDENDVNMISIPIVKCEGDYILTADELKRYFGVEASRMGTLPEYLIIPRLYSTYNADAEGFGHWKEGPIKFWKVTGEVVAYKPVAWVPVVRKKRTIPKSTFLLEYEKTTTKIETSELYGKFAASFTMSIGGGWKAMKMELSTTASVEASYKTSTEVKEKITETGHGGDVVIVEVMMGMCLRVERVFERSVKWDVQSNYDMEWDEKATSDGFTFDELRDVEALRFRNVAMTGDVPSVSPDLQVLPEFNAARELTDLHLAMTFKGMRGWYLYNGGTRTVNSKRRETLSLPDSKKPLVTFIAFDDIKAAKAPASGVKAVEPPAGDVKAVEP